MSGIDTPTTAPPVRLFLALWPAPDVRAALQARRDAWAWPRGASPVHADKLHVTLHFLGDQPAESLPALLDGLAVPFSPFALQVGRAELWHNGIAVLAPQAVPQPLLDLHAALSRALVALGLQPETRAYRPHVTMARRANGVAVPQDGPVVDWQVDGYALVASRGGRYEMLRAYA
jgi:2'-5' RNA ligase